MLAIVVAIALGVQLYFLRPKTDNMEITKNFYILMIVSNLHWKERKWLMRQTLSMVFYMRMEIL